MVTKQELAGQEAASRRRDEDAGAAAERRAARRGDRAMVELTAYNVMRLLHELQAERARMAFK